MKSIRKNRTFLLKGIKVGTRLMVVGFDMPDSVQKQMNRNWGNTARVVEIECRVRE